MKILFICPYYKPAFIYGGPTRSISSLAEALVKAGVHVTVITTDANGHGPSLNIPANRPLIVDGVEVFYYPITKPFSNILPFYSHALGQACLSNITYYDAVYILGNWTYPVYQGANTSIKNRTPYVMSPRGSLMDWSMREKRLKKHLYLEFIERRLINGASAIHVTSSLEEQQIQQWHLKPPIVRIPNGINLYSYDKQPERGKFRGMYGIPKHGTLSLFVGRLHKEKRIDLIINLFADVANKVPDAHLLIVGSDQDGSGQIAREQVSQLGISNNVHFAGILTGLDLTQAYVDADILVLLSHRESFGNVAVEAMSFGVPVLLAKEVGLAEEVKQTSAGVVVNADSIEVSQNWQMLLSDQELRKELGNNGRKLAQSDFSPDVIARKMIKLFENISE